MPTTDMFITEVETLLTVKGRELVIPSRVNGATVMLTWEEWLATRRAELG